MMLYFLVAMGFYKNAYGAMDYYAIMHRFVGPVFLKPNPLTYSELLRTTQ